MNAPEEKKSWDETLKTLLWAVLIAMVFRSFLFEPFHIPSGSMKSSLLVGDYLFVSKYAYGYSRYSLPLGLPLFEGRIGTTHRPARGDVVVFRRPATPRVDWIKRVIGLPGDRVQMKQGKLFINGTAVTEIPLDLFHDVDPLDGTDAWVRRVQQTLPEGRSIAVLQASASGDGNNTQVFTVPEGHYFMMGDNRDHSYDSRFPDGAGFVPENHIVGRAELILFSMDPNKGAFWEFWKWPQSVRGDRFVTLIP